MRCQFCNSEKTQQFLDLGNHPPCIFLTQPELKDEKAYPLNAHYCPDCDLIQLGTLVPQEILFGENYHHIAALSSSFKTHLAELAENCAKRFKLGPKDLIIDLGSNDGALLEAFKAKGTKVLGVDPSDVAQMAIDKGLPTLVEFFTEESAPRIVKQYGKAKVMTALNTFAHVSNLGSFVRGIRETLTDDGVFVSENHYALDLLQGLQYDFIYHEHSRYYTVRHLVSLFGKFGMEVFDVERIPTHSGSIRVFAGKKGAHPVSKVVAELLAAEDAFGLAKADTYKAFAKKVVDHKKAFTDLLRGLKAKGSRIMGLTFPARAVTLLNFCGIGPETFDAITEGSAIKIGRYSPGTHIKVVDQEVLFGKDAPEYGVLLSWHIQKEIVPKFRAKGFKGKFIIPLPTPTIID